MPVKVLRSVIHLHFIPFSSSWKPSVCCLWKIIFFWNLSFTKIIITNNFACVLIFFWSWRQKDIFKHCTPWFLRCAFPDWDLYGCSFTMIDYPVWIFHSNCWLEKNEGKHSSGTRHWSQWKYFNLHHYICRSNIVMLWKPGLTPSDQKILTLILPNST